MSEHSKVEMANRDKISNSKCVEGSKVFSSERGGLNSFEKLDCGDGANYLRWMR